MLAVGVVPAVPLFLLGYLVVGSGLSWWRAGIVALAAFLLLHYAFPHILGIEPAPGRLLDLRSAVWP